MAPVTSLHDDIHGITESESEVAIESAKAITADVFGCEVVVNRECDPEFPQDRYIVFSVVAEADPKTIVRLEGEWVRRIRCASFDWKSFRLSIKPKQ